MIRSVVAIGAACAILTVGPAATAAAQQWKDDAYIDLQQERIAKRLKDPEGAKFSGVFVSRSLGAPIVCGEVNAKNSLGGYAGAQRFLSGGKVQVLENDMKAGEMDSLWAKACAK